MDCLGEVRVVKGHAKQREGVYRVFQTAFPNHDAELKKKKKKKFKNNPKVFLTQQRCFASQSLNL